MSNLFKKALVFTDLHLGYKSDSVRHNEDCLNFINWVTDLGQAQGCDTCLFLGDWHHNRATINLHTLNYSIKALSKLSTSFNNTFFIPGNHDIFYRDKRDIHGAEWAKHIPNIHIVNDWFKDGDVVIAPWLVQDDHKRLKKLRGQYMFGHFELPSFMMNAQVEMPDTGEIRLDDFKEFHSVFSGHFHIRQQKANIHYIGNAFPHNYSDVNDDRRGAMILEWGETPQYFSWDKQPVYRIFKLSELIDHHERILTPQTHCKVHLDIDISYEEASFIRETFITKYKVREMNLVPIKTDSIAQDLAPGDVKFESVDQIIHQQLSAISSDFYDPALLLDIYKTL
jgi:hypothetical protein